jgi:hypothetical protein
LVEIARLYKNNGYGEYLFRLTESGIQ